MKPGWSLREEIFRATHHWPRIVAFCLAGGILGWIISLALPSPYRATQEIYVGLVAYRYQKDRSAGEHSGLEFTNPDDYKNWQMANLNSLIYMDGIIEETLADLQQQDSSWGTTSPAKLRDMLRAYWRNAGKWDLTAQDPDTQRAAQAVNAWQAVVFRRVRSAIDSSQRTMELEIRLKSLAEIHTQAIIQAAMLEEILLVLHPTQAKLTEIAPQDKISGHDLKQVRLLLEEIPPSQAIQQLLETFPPTTAQASEFKAWIDQAILLLETNKQLVEAQAEVLEIEINEEMRLYREAAQASLGLSANLLIEPITDAPPAISTIRPTGSMVLVGSALGLLGWALAWIHGISRRVSP